MDDSYEPLFRFLRHLRSMTDADLETFAVGVWISAGLGPQEELPAEGDRYADAGLARGEGLLKTVSDSVPT
jgi:hypothetical protein